MKGITIHEFDALCAGPPDLPETGTLRSVPADVYRWLEGQCAALADREETAWLRLTGRQGRPAVRVTSFAGVVRAPDGFQIEVLPKVGKAIAGGHAEARQLLIDMLRCLPGFRHIVTDRARLLAARMPLPDIFISEFLRAVERIVKHGLRSDYIDLQDDVAALRGKLLTGPHLRRNMFRMDRFFTEHDEFSADRPENRLVHTALRRVLALTGSPANQRSARELGFVFADVPLSQAPADDFRRLRPDRTMTRYGDALGWARLILGGLSPLTGAGSHPAPSLLFPMEALFEAFVAARLSRQVVRPLYVRTQSRGRHLVHHRERDWFRLVPDILVREGNRNRLVMDTKWKLLDGRLDDPRQKYGLSERDFYQMLAYGLNYLDGGKGDMALVYPKTDVFDRPLPPFVFSGPVGLRLWALPFCLRSRSLRVPADGPFSGIFHEEKVPAAVD